MLLSACQLLRSVRALPSLLQHAVSENYALEISKETTGSILFPVDTFLPNHLNLTFPGLGPDSGIETRAAQVSGTVCDT